MSKVKKLYFVAFFTADLSQSGSSSPGKSDVCEIVTGITECRAELENEV